MPTDEAIRELKALIADQTLRSTNEAGTRHKIIDFIIHEILAWPRNRVEVEEHIRPGFADYILTRNESENLLLIEAKKEGVYFDLPRAHKTEERYGYIPLSSLLSDTNIAAAVKQARSYCLDIGCEYAAVTNGHEWIFFKIFEKGKRWDELRAFVIRTLEFFSADFTKAFNHLSYTSVIEHASLTTLLTSAPPRDRSIYFASERIPSYSHTISANRLAQYLRPLVNHYFGVIGDDDAEFMDRCYVSQRDYHQTLDGMRTLIQDTLTPYLKDYGVQQLEDTGKGGRLGGRLTKTLKKGRRGEVLVLFGGKGAGKSTFVKRLLHHNPPRWLRDNSVIAIIDLLKTPEDTAVIRAALWSELIRALDTDNLLTAERGKLLSTLFQDRFAIAGKQELAGLEKASESYNTRLNDLVTAWKKDHRYCAVSLSDYWRERAKGIIVVIDNTDQFTGANQDFCFTSAQEIADELGCVVLISMREERFHNSKVHGVLDAFQNAGFHISSPKPAQVFKKRLDYTAHLLNRRDSVERLPDASETDVEDARLYLNIINREFSADHSPLTSFLTACAHGDTRLSLDLFRSFLLSGYTNVEEMLAAGRWDFQIHQVIKPVMVPNRYFYDENLSDIPNVYQLRYARHCSHFTGLRVLRKLAKLTEGSSAGYLPLAQLRSYFAETFNMVEDLHANLDVLLKQGFVEANNRLDYYSEEVDSVKITGYGTYMLNGLAFQFTYLDLICTDTGVFKESVSHYLSEAAKNEYDLFLRHKRHERIRVRLNRVQTFISYLREEEERERGLYKLNMPENEMFTHRTSQSFDSEKGRVLASAAKQPEQRRRR